MTDFSQITSNTAVQAKLRRLAAYGTVTVHPTRWEDRADFFRRIAPAEVVINVRAYSVFDDEALAHAPKLPAPASRRVPTKLAPVSSALTVQRFPWGYRVSGDRIERLVQRTDLDSDSALQGFQVELDRIGVSAALESAGVKAGDTVRIGPTEFEYQP